MAVCCICDHEITVLCARCSGELTITDERETGLPQGTEIRIEPCECKTNEGKGNA